MRHLRILGAIILFGGIANVSFAWALVYGNVVRVMVLFYLLPLWGVLGGRFLLGETIDLLRALAMFCALVGAILVLGGPELLRAPPNWIDLVAMLSGFAFAMNNICFRASQALPVPIKVGAMFIGCSLVSTTLIGLNVQAVPSDVSLLTWSLVVAFGFGILVATSGTQWGVNHMEAGRSSIIMILELLGAAVSSAIILGTRLTQQELLGGVLIIRASLLDARGKDEEPALQGKQLFN
jgi:drug/metabolite transporter (DMT)-like permease